MEEKILQEELCRRFKVSETDLKKHYSRVQEKVFKEGYELKKVKVNKEWEYSIVERNVINDTGYLSLEIFTELKDYCFLLVLLLACLQFETFRGTVDELLILMNIKVTAANKQKLYDSINILKAKKYVYGAEDPADNKVFNLSLSVKYIKELKISHNMMYKSSYLAIHHKKRGYYAILKTWLAIQYFVWDNHRKARTYNDFVSLTNLPVSAIRDSIKLLEEENIIKTKKAYLRKEIRIGTNYDINAFDENNRENVIVEDKEEQNEAFLFEV